MSIQKMGKQLINNSFQKIKHNLTANWNVIPMNYHMKIKSSNPSTWYRVLKILYVTGKVSLILRISAFFQMQYGTIIMTS